LFVSPGFAGRAGSFRACAETFRQYSAEKIAEGELFRRAEAFPQGKAFSFPLAPDGVRRYNEITFHLTENPISPMPAALAERKCQ